MDIREQFERTGEYPLHDGTDLFLHHLFLALMDLEYELVMDLKEHSGFITPFHSPFSGGYGMSFQKVRHLYHGKFNNIRSGSLNRHIDGFAFRSGTDHLITVPDTGNIPSAPIECFDEPIFCRSIQYGLVVRTNSRIEGIECLDVLGRLGRRSIDHLGESESGDTVDDPEIDRFRYPAELGGDDRLLPEQKPRRTGMDILSSDKGIYEGLISRETCQNPEFHLRIISDQK